MTRLALIPWSRTTLLGALLVMLASLVGCATKHSIHFDSSPKGASVKEDRLGYQGVTPFDGRFRPGSNLDLTFSLPGYEDVRRSILDIQNSRIVMAELVQHRTSVGVTTFPAGASLEFHTVEGTEIRYQLSGKVRGKHEPINQNYSLQDNIKEIVITMKRRGYRTKTETVKIEPMKENLFSFQMEKITTEIVATSDPSGAEVYESTLGFLGRTPLNKEFSSEEMQRLCIGKDIDLIDSVALHLEFTKPNHKPVEMITIMSLDQGDTTKYVNATLQADAFEMEGVPFLVED
jgi:hypothetical protein